MVKEWMQTEIGSHQLFNRVSNKEYRRNFSKILTKYGQKTRVLPPPVAKQSKAKQKATMR